MPLQGPYLNGSPAPQPQGTPRWVWLVVATLGVAILFVVAVLAAVVFWASSPSKAEAVVSTCHEEVGDVEAATLLADGESVNYNSGPSIDASDTMMLDCLLRETGAPSSVEARIGATRALDGTQESVWGDWSVFWNYHPDAGLEATFAVN